MTSQFLLIAQLGCIDCIISDCSNGKNLGSYSIPRRSRSLETSPFSMLVSIAGSTDSKIGSCFLSISAAILVKDACDGTKKPSMTVCKYDKEVIEINCTVARLQAAIIY